MKIDLIMPLNLNRKQSNSIATNYQTVPLAQSTEKRPFSNYPIGYIPHQINFGASEWSLLKEIQELKKLPYLPCFYCGQEMIPPRILDSIKNVEPEKYTKAAIDLITYFENALLPVEKKVFEEIKGIHAKNPEASFMGIMMEARSNNLSKLKPIQLGIVNDIDKMSLNLSLNRRKHVLKITKNARVSISEKYINTTPFKRKSFINELETLVATNNRDKNTLKMILDKAQTIPSSEDSTSAFIVKYALGKNTQVIRTNEEIADRLIRRSFMSVEHIKPKDVFKTSGNLTEMNDIGNLAITHQLCNENRDIRDLSEYLKSHKYAVGNMQKYIDYVISKINDGTLIECDKYPERLKETVFEQSKGVVNLNISALKIPNRVELSELAEVS